jgi:hypothetical protein
MFGFRQVNEAVEDIVKNLAHAKVPAGRGTYRIGGKTLVFAENPRVAGSRRCGL